MMIARSRSRDLLGILLISAGTISLLGLAGLTRGGLVDPWIGLLESWLGWGAIVIPLTGLAGVLYFLITFIAVIFRTILFLGLCDESIKQ